MREVEQFQTKMLKLGLDEFAQIVIPFQVWAPRFSNKWGEKLLDQLVPICKIVD